MAHRESLMTFSDFYNIAAKPIWTHFEKQNFL